MASPAPAPAAGGALHLPARVLAETFAVLRQHGVALCLAETDAEAAPLDVLTAGFVYARLRREEYGPDDLAAWRRRCRDWVAIGRDVYTYFKHEDAAKGPAYARALLTPE